MPSRIAELVGQEPFMFPNEGTNCPTWEAADE